MCGRYANSEGDEAVAKEFGVIELIGDALPPSWNIAPTDPARVVLERAAEGASTRQLRTARWGLVPSWAADKSGAARRINARVETVTAKPAYRAAASRRRALLPASGYFEWQRTPTGKAAHFMHRGEDMLAFAGLYEMWRDPARGADDPDRWVWTYTILTRPAPDALGHIHDRSPVLVPAALRTAWLDPGLTDLGKVDALIASMPDPGLTPTPVGPAVGDVRNDGPHLVLPQAAPAVVIPPVVIPPVVIEETLL